MAPIGYFTVEVMKRRLSLIKNNHALTLNLLDLYPLYYLYKFRVKRKSVIINFLLISFIVITILRTIE